MNLFTKFVFVPLGGDCVALTGECCSVFSLLKKPYQCSLLLGCGGFFVLQSMFLVGGGIVIIFLFLRILILHARQQGIDREQKTFELVIPQTMVKNQTMILPGNYLPLLPTNLRLITYFNLASCSFIAKQGYNPIYNPIWLTQSLYYVVSSLTAAICEYVPL